LVLSQVRFNGESSGEGSGKESGEGLGGFDKKAGQIQ
jgi:hypothetical protein